MPAALTLLLGGVNITTSVDMSSLQMQLAGSQEIATCDFDIVDTTNSIVAADEATVSVTEVDDSTVLFGGFVRARSVAVIATGRLIHITAADYNSLLDRSIVVSDSRTAGESDFDRLVYLMTTYGSQFSSDYGGIGTLNSSMPAQKFIALTLRQAIERVLGQASQKSSYYVDPTGRLHTYDRSAVAASAPFNLRIGTPGVGELSPETFSIDNDASNLANAIYVVGATAAGSGWFTDVTSIATYGRRERFFNAPDADTHAKASQVGLAVLEDQKDPVPRGVFTTQSPKDDWRINQRILINSTQHGLVNASYRIARVTAKYLNSVGDRDYTIEVGAPLRSLSTLLGAAHGGGGGFPWHSPGGAGGWGPVTGGGTTGGGGSVSGSGGCACNTPYAPFILDDFNRTLPSTWGTSSSGGIWAVAGSTGLSQSVDGAYGIIDGTSVSNTLYRMESIPLPAGYGFGTEALIRFSYTGTALFRSFQVALTETFGFVGGAGIDSTATSGQIHVFADSDGSGATTSGGTGAWVGSATSSFYYLRIAWPDSATVQAKFWQEVNPEPADWQSTESHAIGATWTPGYFMIGIYGGMKLFVDQISLNATGAGSGQPYAWTNLGPGNGARSSWTTQTPFRAGSLEVRVDQTFVTPISSTPATGVFTLSFAPSSIESVWARWVVA